MEEYDTYDVSMLEILPSIEENSIIFNFDGGQNQYRIKQEDLNTIIKFLRKT
jgi:hypothetical protein